MNLKKNYEERKRSFRIDDREEKKFEPSIIIAGWGLTDLINQEGTNEFSYAQILLYYKDSYDSIKKKLKEDLYFEQDPIQVFQI